MSIRWDQVAAYFPPQQVSEKRIEQPQQSLGKLNVPSSWTGTGWGQLAENDAASRAEPKAPSVNDPETLPVGTTIYDAGGVRLAVLPDQSVLARSADGSRDISYPSIEAYRSERKDREHWSAIIKY